MTAGHKRLFNHPGFLVGLAAFLTDVLVQSGELGSIDTALRLQTTHSFWTSASLVLPEDYSEIGLVGRAGRIYVPYGIGQSLLMLPSTWSPLTWRAYRSLPPLLSTIPEYAR